MEFKDLLSLLRLKRPIECYPCCYVFKGNALEILKWQMLDHVPRLPRVRIRATGVVADTLQILASTNTALVRRESFTPAQLEHHPHA
jgi:hypothetical protein